MLVHIMGFFDKLALRKYEKEALKVMAYEQEMAALSNEELHAKLEEIDPLEAKKIHPNNRKRIIRAIAIYLSQNKTKSEINSSQSHKPMYEDVRFFVRDLPREELYKRINKRVDMMMDSGLLNEVKSIYEKYGNSLQAMQAIGYKEFVPYFNGQASLENTIELIKKNTRNYAKRQMTFIRHQFPVIFYKNDDQLIEVIKNG